MFVTKWDSFWGDRIKAFWPIFSQAMLQSAINGVWMVIHWVMEIYTLYFLHPPSTSPAIQYPSKSTDLIIQVKSASIKLVLAREIMWTWLKIFWSLSQICDHINCSTYEVVSRSLCRADNGKWEVICPSWNVSISTKDFFLDHCFYIW